MESTEDTNPFLTKMNNFCEEENPRKDMERQIDDKRSEL
jgi:hypothetical protein